VKISIQIVLCSCYNRCDEYLLGIHIFVTNKNNFMKKIFYFSVLSLFLGCSPKGERKESVNIQTVERAVEFNNECDCKRYAVEHKIALPELDDLILLSDSFGTGVPGEFDHYRIVNARVEEIRKKYDVGFKECYKKFGDLDIVNSACTDEEVRIRAFSKAMRLVKNNCRGSNQELVKYMAVKSDDKLIFMFMSVAENGMVCISGVSEINPDEILSTDCGEANVKMAEWEALPEYKIKLQ